MNRLKALSPDLLCHYCDTAQFDFETTAELDDLSEAIGQARAMEAIQFGIGIRQHGYNLYALGPEGTGKQGVVMQLLSQKAQHQPEPWDWCYVNNFDHPHKPSRIRLPRGEGGALRRCMATLIDELRVMVPAAFDGDDYRAKVREIDEALQRRQDEAIEEVGNAAKAHDIALIRTPTGFAFAPLKGEEVISPRDFHKFTDEKQEDVHHEVDDLQTQLQNVFNQIPQWRREAKAQLKALNEEVAGRVIDQMVDEVRQQFAAFPEVLGYLDALHNDLIQSVEDFRSEGEQEAAHLAFGPNRNSLFQRYQVNVLVDHGDTAGAPVVYEDNPTYQNLVGRIDHQSMMGTLFTDFTLIKAGALHRANHGYLVLDAFKLLQHPFSWEALKRALSASEIHVSTLEQMLSLVSTVTLDPQPIPLEVKVVLVGDRHLYYMLYQLDPEFKELFKVAADFEDEVQRSDSNNALYARMIGTMVKRQGLKPFDRGGVARVIEHGARLVEDAEKLTTHRRSVADLLCEADYWAAEAGREVVGREDVQHAIDAQMHRAGRMMENIQESILRHQLMIDTEGERVGQVNGLTVMELGDLAFGAPSRITARVRMGDGELIDIEREVDMGGPIHSKGVLILSGFLGQRYVYETPLALSASLVFEQSYGEVEGDSASAGELFALLSAISGLPLTQAIAVTGSVNQHGEIQPIGGVNEKIEGFFDICKQRGFAPGQGVLIPAANRSDLMLKEEVVAAARQGLFSVYAITTIDEGIELLTGVAAGEADAEGQYPEASVNAAVARQLLRFARIRHEFGDDKKEEQDDDHDRGEAADKVHHDEADEAKERP